jgi:two-component system cell cycle sensor histidine kinase/response regulator CckA
VPSGRYVMLAVSDTGCGMDAGTQARLFEPFFTTKEAGKGTGLGLATVYGIVKQSKGYIWIYSELQKGTTFKIYLPRIQELPETAPLARVKAETPSIGNETILLVEDEAMLRVANREFLEFRGYTVLEASNGDEALRVCANYDRQIHLLLTDVVMPGKGGPDLANAILNIRPGIRVIYMSGYTDSSIDTRVLAPNVAFLQKPCSLETLERTIRAMLDS